MANIKIVIPGFGENEGESPLVILGPNGSGKTQLAKRISRMNKVTAISAQRRTWLDDSLPVMQEENLKANIISQQDNWYSNSWHPTEEINWVLSNLIQDHTSQLTLRNEEAIKAASPLDPVKHTKLIVLQSLWDRLFPKRKLQIGGFFPKVSRLDESSSATYQLREMSDGERTVLYMAARVLTAEHPVILVDEPELHMHSRLAIQFWNEAEKLRPDCRFIYVTHDLNFTLSRRNATCLIARSGENAEAVVVDQLPSSIAADVLGAATLPFYARRIFFFEGQPANGFASEFFSIWFDDDETFAIPAGDRNAVCASVAGLRKVGVVAADVSGLVDRDFYPISILDAVPDGVKVLTLHELESVLCDQRVVTAVATFLGKEADAVWASFLDGVRTSYRDQNLNSVIAKRVRSRVGDLLDGAFSGSQIVPDSEQTMRNHCERLSGLDLPAKTSALFKEEAQSVRSALAEGGTQLLATLPGKHLLSILAKTLGFKDTSEFTGLIMRALNTKEIKKEKSLIDLGSKVEAALLSYLPIRRLVGPNSTKLNALEAQP